MPCKEEESDSQPSPGRLPAADEQQIAQKISASNPTHFGKNRKITLILGDFGLTYRNFMYLYKLEKGKSRLTRRNHHLPSDYYLDCGLRLVMVDDELHTAIEEINAPIAKNFSELCDKVAHIYEYSTYLIRHH